MLYPPHSTLLPQLCVPAKNRAELFLISTEIHFFYRSDSQTRVYYYDIEHWKEDDTTIPPAWSLTHSLSQTGRPKLHANRLENILTIKTQKIVKTL